MTLDVSGGHTDQNGNNTDWPGGREMTVVPAMMPGDRLESLYAPVLEDLAKVDAILRQQLQSKVTFIDELTGRVRFYQGKRVRPALLLLSGQAAGTVSREHHVLGAVIEMIHTATLVHDDLLDDADTRRHVTTVHTEWGNEPAVLLGDYLFSQAYYLAATLDTAEACRDIGLATNRTCEGELRQVSLRGNFDLTEEEYVEIVAGKTAELIACACRLGARTSGALAEQVHAAERFGWNIGVAFQIADDLLDVVGEEEKTGKSVGTDWLKRKMTLPLIRLRETSSAEDRDRLRRLFEDTADRSADVKSWVRQSDALAFTAAQAKKYALAGAEELAKLPDTPSKQCLLRIAQFAANRSF